MLINILDFDGVIIDPLEDTVFRLPEQSLDNIFIKCGRDRYGIGKLCNHIQRLRHMILQEILFERGLIANEGPYAHLVNDTPFYVLTARSSPGAVSRVCEFFEQRDTLPQEMFMVGPMSKNHILSSLCETFNQDKLVFYDDTKFHIDNAKSLALSNLECVFVDNKPELLGRTALRFYHEQCNWLVEQQRRKTPIDLTNSHSMFDESMAA